MYGYQVTIASLLACLAAATPASTIAKHEGVTSQAQTHIQLLPCVHPTVDLGNLDNLKATKDANLHYDSDPNPMTDSSTATVHAPTSELPIVQLENTFHIKSVICTDNAAKIVFSDRTAYQIAANDWNGHENFVIVSYSPSCGSAHEENKRDFVLVKSVSLHPSKMTIDAVIEFIDFTTAFGKSTLVTADLGKYVAPKAKRESISKSETFTWNNYPTNSLNENQWGSGYQLLSESDLQVVCVGCGTQGSMTLAGSFTWSWFSVKSADVTLTGNMQATVQVGIESTGIHAKIPIDTIQLVQIPLGSIDIPGILNIGPQIDINAGASVEIDASGSLLVGATLNWPSVNADCNIYGGSSSGSGFEPTITPVNQANGSVSVTLDLHLPVSIGIGINVLDGLFNKQIAVVDTPGFQITGSDSDTSSCNGIDLSADIYNDVGVNILGITTIGIASWTTPLFDTCLGTSTTSSAAASTTAAVTTTDSAPVTTPTDTTPTSSPVTPSSNSTSAAITSPPTAPITTGGSPVGTISSQGSGSLSPIFPLNTTSTAPAYYTTSAPVPIYSASGAPPYFSSHSSANSTSIVATGTAPSSTYAHPAPSHSSDEAYPASSYSKHHHHHHHTKSMTLAAATGYSTSIPEVATYSEHYRSHSTTLAAETTSSTSSYTTYHTKAPPSPEPCESGKSNSTQADHTFTPRKGHRQVKA